MGYYHIAQVCLNGHMINDSYDTHPELNQIFCSKCGSEAIAKCPNCGSNIHGDYEVPGVSWAGGTESPDAYCYNCGKPYPWTEKAINCARALIEEDDQLKPDEKQQFSDTLPDLIVQSPTPNTQLSAVRFKRLIAKAAVSTGDAIKSIIVDIASEAIIKSLGM